MALKLGVAGGGAVYVKEGVDGGGSGGVSWCCLKGACSDVELRYMLLRYCGLSGLRLYASWNLLSCLRDL